LLKPSTPTSCPNTSLNFGVFDTHEEWEAYERQLAEQLAEKDREFDIEVLKYLRGEPNDIRSGTLEMVWAETAKGLVEKDAALLLPANREELRNKIRAIYDSEYVDMPF
jgi:hypothetical protein